MFLELDNGISLHDTLRRVFQRLNPKTLQGCFTEWVAGLRVKASSGTIVIDGKTVRGGGLTEAGTPVLHSVSAWASDVRLTLAQLKTDENPNEITAIPALFDLIDITGCIVTIDAMGCQTKIAERIVEGKAGYVLTLKGNQPNLLENISGFFETELAHNFRDASHQFRRTINKDHGRLEVREYCHTDNVSWTCERHSWIGLACQHSQTHQDVQGEDLRRYPVFHFDSVPGCRALCQSGAFTLWNRALAPLGSRYHDGRGCLSRTQGSLCREPGCVAADCAQPVQD